MKHSLRIFFLISILVSCKNQSNSDITIPELKVRANSIKITEMIFGKYCGECYGNCAPMFFLKIENDKPIFFGDFEDTFFSDEKRFEFKTDLNQQRNIKIAIEIAKKLPDKLYNWKADNETFGCPDCRDQCGFYLEFKKKNNESKTFQLDLLMKTEKIPKEVIEYTYFLAKKINSITK